MLLTQLISYHSLRSQVYGPHLAILYASPLAFKAVNSLGHFFNPSATLANKLGLAGAVYELTSSLPHVLDYFSPSLPAAFEAIEKHEGVLQAKLLDYLNSRSDVTIYGEREADTKKRVSTISFTVEGHKSEDFVLKVDEATAGQTGIRWGGFYSVRLNQEVLGLGPDGSVRISMVHYNTCELNSASDGTAC